MTRYRAVLQFVTSGNAVVETRTEWVHHKDQVEEIVEALKPLENKRSTFTGYEIEQSTVVADEP